MPTVKEIFGYLNAKAPVFLAEDYDNPGILAGEPEREVSSAALTLDITAEAAKEAAKAGAQLVISHHPVIFHPLRAVLASGVSAPVWQLARLGLSAICMHTNLDAANGGVNDALASVLGLSEIEKLGELKREHYKKLVVFVPREHADKVRGALAAAGAGKLGAYDGCAFESQGSGYFRPLSGSHPFIGENGRTEKVDEVRVEAVCPPEKVENAIEIMKSAHPYEVPAYDVFDDEAVSETFAMGRLGHVPEQKLTVFAAMVKSALESSCAKIVDCGKKVSAVAVCGGAADSRLIAAAAGAGADTLVTGEMKHNLYYEAREVGLNVVEAGHFATEAVVLPVLCKELTAAFPKTSFKIADCCREPYSAV